MATGPQRALNFLMTNSSALHFVVDSGIGRAVGRSNVVVARLFAPLVVGGMLVSTFIELAVLCVKLPVTVLQFFANVRIVNLSVGENLADIGRTALRIVFFTATFFVSVIIPKTLFAAFERAHAEERCRDCQDGRPNRLPPGAGVGRPVGGEIGAGLRIELANAQREVREAQEQLRAPHADVVLPGPLRQAEVEAARRENQIIAGEITERLAELDALIGEMGGESVIVRHQERFQRLAIRYVYAVRFAQTVLGPIRRYIAARIRIEERLLQRQDHWQLDGLRNLRPVYQRDLESIQAELATLRETLVVLRRERAEERRIRAEGEEAILAQRQVELESRDILRGDVAEEEEARAAARGREMAQRRAMVEGLAAVLPMELDAILEDEILNLLINDHRREPNPEIQRQIVTFMGGHRLAARRPERAQEIRQALDRIQAQNVRRQRLEQEALQLMRLIAANQHVIGARAGAAGQGAAALQNP